MKKYILGLLIMLSVCLIGCGSIPEPEKRTSTELCENLYTTYVYNPKDDTIISKNVYDKTTGVTTEYVYYYTDEGRGKILVGFNVITISKEGKVMGEFENMR